MTRRQFLACLLMAIVVLVCLPLVKFTEWGERWFGKSTTTFDSILRKLYHPDGIGNPMFTDSPFLNMLKGVE